MPSTGQCVCDDGYRSDPSESVGCGDGDMVSLLAFRNSGDPRHVLRSWSSCSLMSPLANDPNVTADGTTAWVPLCSSRPGEAGGDWNNRATGFVGVMCNAPYPTGRVTFVFPLQIVRPFRCGLQADIAPLAGLPYLETLSLDGCAAVHGDLSALAGLVELRYLNLRGTSVHGRLDAVAGMSHLGEGYRAPDGSAGTGLFVAQTKVWGRVEPIRALPGLGPEWGTHVPEFSSCSSPPAVLLLRAVDRRGQVEFTPVDW